MFDRIEGKRVCLRKAREEDWSSMLKNVWSDEAVYRWMLFQPTLTEEEARDRARRSIAFQKDHYAYFVALKDTDEAIGFCGITETSPGHFEETGICVGTAFQGMGLGKEILALLLDLTFEKLGAEDARYGYFQDNERSKALAEHFGFHYDHTYTRTRPWDGAEKIVCSCLLTRAEYFAWKKANPQ